jgi:hypothetical protein
VSAARLLRLYPRAWRERYAEEFMELVGDERLGAAQTFDILMGAIDARLSRSVAPARDRARADTQGGDAMLTALKAYCARVEQPTRFTTRDSLIGAAIVIGVAIVCLVVGERATLAGYPSVEEFTSVMGVSAGLLISMPFWLLKNQPWRAQTVVVGVPLVILTGIAAVSAWV